MSEVFIIVEFVYKNLWLLLKKKKMHVSFQFQIWHTCIIRYFLKNSVVSSRINSAFSFPLSSK